MPDPVGEARESLERRLRGVIAPTIAVNTELLRTVLAVLSSLRPSASQLGSPSHRTDGDGECSKAAISHERARDAARRLIAGAFRRDGERLDPGQSPRFSIPTRPTHDDDVVLVDYIAQQAALAASPLPPVTPAAEFDGVLRNAVIGCPYGTDTRRVASGEIYGDRKGRFREGEWVTTSFIVSGPDEHGVIKTRNSTYRLEMAPLPSARAAPATSIGGSQRESPEGAEPLPASLNRSRADG